MALRGGACLLEELQNSLLRLVGLRQGCHAGLFQNVVLRHLRDRRADVSVLNVVLCAGQVRYLRIFNVLGGCQLVDGSADGAAGLRRLC